MLVLNKSDIGNPDPNFIQASVQKAYEIMQDNRFNMPDRVHISDRENMLLLMPCFSGSYFATKLVSIFPDAVKQALPVINGVVVLCDNVSGRPLAILDGAAVTARRTGAVGGLAVARLTPPSIETAGILGAGVQGLSQTRFLLLNRPIQQLYVYDINPAAAGDMARQVGEEFPGLRVTITENPERLVESSQVIIAATTTRTPLFSLPVKTVQGKTFISIGSYRPDMREFPDAVIEAADGVFVDTLFAMEESGDLAIPLKSGVLVPSRVQPFSSLLGKASASISGSEKIDGKTLFFKSVGMALFDLVVASDIYETAVKLGMGRKLDF